MSQSRIKKTLLNARVSMIFYFFSIGVAFYSRKIFIEYLGADFMGLTETLSGILQYLNIAELGVGTAIALNLYKPLNDKNYEKMTEIMSLFKFIYRKIGIYIVIGAVIVSLFFPIIFSNTGFENGIIYYAFFSILFSSLVGYFVNYRTILITADQKDYYLIKYTESTRIITILIQMFLLYKTRNLFLYLSVNILLTIVNSYIINLKLDKEYPWLKTSAILGKNVKENYQHIFNYVKKIFIHKIKDVGLHHSDKFLIFSFESLSMIVYYGNYTLIATRAMQFFITALNSLYAGIGNLVAEGNEQLIRKVFWETMTIRYFISGTLVFSMYHLISPFIILWLGKEYLLGNTILILFMIETFISNTRSVVDMFNNAYGHYNDVWAAWAEIIITIFAALIGGYYFGLAGILMGKITGLFLIIVLWKPFYLFKKGFKMPVLEYWKENIKYHFIFFSTVLLVSYFIKPMITINPSENFLYFISYSILLCSCFGIIYALLLLFFTKGTKSLLLRVPAVKNYFNSY